MVYFEIYFSTGANISKEKDNNDNAVMSGIVVGSFVAFVIFGFILINIESYIDEYGSSTI